MISRYIFFLAVLVYRQANAADLNGLKEINNQLILIKNDQSNFLNGFGKCIERCHFNFEPNAELELINFCHTQYATNKTNDDEKTFISDKTNKIIFKNNAYLKIKNNQQCKSEMIFEDNFLVDKNLVLDLSQKTISLEPGTITLADESVLVIRNGTIELESFDWLKSSPSSKLILEEIKLLCKNDVVFEQGSIETIGKVLIQSPQKKAFLFNSSGSFCINHNLKLANLDFIFNPNNNDSKMLFCSIYAELILNQASLSAKKVQINLEKGKLIINGKSTFLGDLSENQDFAFDFSKTGCYILKDSSSNIKNARVFIETIPKDTSKFA